MLLSMCILLFLWTEAVHLDRIFVFDGHLVDLSECHFRKVRLAIAAGVRQILENSVRYSQISKAFELSYVRQNLLSHHAV